VKTILVVDDDPVSVRLIEMILTRYGYATETASNAAAALELLDRGQSIDMVITDQNMGQTSGLELYAALRADSRFRQLPVILCTGIADRAMVQEAMTLGIRHFIVKPITPKVVMDKVIAVEAERPVLLMESRTSAMARLQLSDAQYKALIHASQQHLSGLREELSSAYKAGDRVTTVMVAGRLREPATLLVATRLAGAIDQLEGTRTWHDLEDAVELVLEEVAALEDALAIEAKPHLIPNPLGYQGPDR
jgi:CheY-like chemotaxis protein